TINVSDTVAPVFNEATPANTSASCDNIPAPAVLTASDNCGNATVTMGETIIQGNCPSNYQIVRTWTAVDACGNDVSVSQTISISDTTGPVAVDTPLVVKIDATCDNIPGAPTLVFIDNCSAVGVPVFTETTSSVVDGEYTITRTWVVSDACGNLSQTYTQFVFVTQVTDVIAQIPAESCNEAEFDTIDLNTLLPEGTPTNGTWTNNDNVAGLTGTVFNAWQVPAGLYTFTYTIVDGPCPRSYEIKMTVNTDCGVQPCENIIIHNAFTPNGDGLNEYFNIENIEDINCYPSNKVEIYNRWGVLVYETKNYDNNTRRFIGISEGRTTIETSAELPSGTYFYIIQWTTTEGNTINKNGYLYLTR
ncbi:gliding motility-associated C-terminal domain-containing protein, partial [Flavobacterium sp. RSB2_4_14]|uniref:gliding motility-associated C-terminal domain-containing protein n=1 Tax=Flavobacterium sp. RSB2_4_14 TaxID=3447665 RepID=UPI003F2E86D7